MYNQFVRAAVCASILAASAAEAPMLAAAPAPPAKANAAISEIDLRDITVGDALRMLSTQYGINVVASEKAAKIRTALFLRDVKPIEILDALSKAYNLWYQEDPQSRIVRLFTVDEFRLGQVDSVEDQTEIFTLRYPNATDVAYAIRNLYGDRVALQVANNQQEVNQELQSRFSRFSIVDRQRLNIGGNIFGSSSSAGGGGIGGGGGSVGNLNQQSRVDKEDIQEAMGSVKKYTQDAETQAMLSGSAAEGTQKVAEAERKLSPIYVTVIRSQNRVLVRARDPEAMRQIKDLVMRLDMEQASLLLEVKLLSIDLADHFESAFSFKELSGDLAGTVLLPGAADTGGALLAKFANNQFETKIKLLQQEGRVTELATPMLMTTNQEVSRVFVGEERPVTTSYTSSSTTTTTATGGVGNVVTPILVPQTTVKPIGTTLLITPNINADRTVNMRLVVEQSSLSLDKATIQVPLQSTNVFGQTETTLQDAKVDVIKSRIFSGTIVGKDKLSVAIGGLIEEGFSDTESKVPVLGDIPGLGLLFKDQAKVRSRKELVIVLRPHIQSTPTESSQISQDFLKQESIHPNAQKPNGGLDLYNNMRHKPGDFRMDQENKMFPLQDQFKQPQ